MNTLLPHAKETYIRTHYLNKLWPIITTHTIAKIVVGQRRSGKSTLLKQVMTKLCTEGLATEDQLLYINFELPKWQYVIHAAHLFAIIETHIRDWPADKALFLILDEIQEVSGWEKVVSGYLAEERPCHIILTGSNSKLLSSELATFLTGRYIEIEIQPFSFEEHSDYKRLPQHKATLIEYLSTSGIPELYHLPNIQDTHIAFLSALKDSIVMKDIVHRYAIKSPQLLEMLFAFLRDNIGNLFSISTMVHKLHAIGIQTNAITLASYLNHLESAYLIFGLSRYDVKGKKILEGEKKYYLNDLGFRNYFSSQFDIGMSKNLENYVFTTLKRFDYQVHVGRIGPLEIDFIAEKNRKTHYFQVTYLLHSETVVEREYGNLRKCQDQWPKTVISLDDMQLPDNEGITHVQAWKLESFLRNLH